MADRWSIAWRIHDAQFWGVAQRRERLALVADFGGQSAPEILFERESLSGNFSAVSAPQTVTPRQAEKSADQAGVLMTLQALGEYKEVGVASTLKQRDYKDATDLVLTDKGPRRLTPTEHERLQGFPDGWTDIGEWTDTKGKKHKPSDAPRYRALGISIALPFWEWLAGRITDQLKKDGVINPTMASLFDGIGGFPLVFSRCGCQPVWASEIEEFPIAVSKYHFPE